MNVPSSALMTTLTNEAAVVGSMPLETKALLITRTACWSPSSATARQCPRPYGSHSTASDWVSSNRAELPSPEGEPNGYADHYLSRFRAIVFENEIVLVDFWASWCGPCRMFAPVFERVSQANPDIVFGKVDAEAEQALAPAARISSIPTLMVFKRGVLVLSQPGALSEQALNHGDRRRPSARRGPVARRGLGPGRRPAGECVMTGYTLATIVARPYGETVDAVRTAPAVQGFGSLTEIDLKGALKAKLGVDVPGQVILGACRPPLAHRAI